MTGPRLARTLAVLAAVLALAARYVPAQQATFSAVVEAVRIDALVTDGNHVVRGLGPADFQVRDNDVPQDVSFVRFEEWPLNVVLVLDSSESVVGPRLESLRAAGLAAVAGLRDGDQAALVVFDHRVTLAAPPATAFDALRAAIERITAGGGTALYDAVHAGIVLGASREKRSVVLVFTDGTDTSSFLTKEAVVDSARRGGTVVYAVVEGRDTGFLKDVTATTGGSVTSVSSTKDLDALFVRILDEFRQRYLIGYSPRGVAKDGWHRLAVTVSGRRYHVKTRTGYQVGR